MKNGKEKDSLSTEREKLQKNAIVRLFRRRKIRELSNQIQEVAQTIQSDRDGCSSIQTNITGLQNGIRENEQQLINLCGVGLKEYEMAMSAIEDEGITQEQLQEKIISLREKVEQSKSREREQEKELDEVRSKEGIKAHNTKAKDEARDYR